MFEDICKKQPIELTVPKRPRFANGGHIFGPRVVNPDTQRIDVQVTSDSKSTVEVVEQVVAAATDLQIFLFATKRVRYQLTIALLASAVSPRSIV